MENNKNDGFKTIMIGMLVIIIGLAVLILCYNNEITDIISFSTIALIFNFDTIYKIITLILLILINSKLKKLIKK